MLECVVWYSFLWYGFCFGVFDLLGIMFWDVYGL